MTLALLLKSLLGALAVVLISLLSRSRNYYIAGLVPLFPFALIAHYIVGERGALALKTTVLFGMWSLLPYFICLACIACWTVCVCPGRWQPPR
jgi:uncharacterized membrane protein (GlpM family)